MFTTCEGAPGVCEASSVARDGRVWGRRGTRHTTKGRVYRSAERNKEVVFSHHATRGGWVDGEGWFYGLSATRNPQKERKTPAQHIYSTHSLTDSRTGFRVLGGLTMGGINDEPLKRDICLVPLFLHQVALFPERTRHTSTLREYARGGCCLQASGGSRARQNIDALFIVRLGVDFAHVCLYWLCAWWVETSG